MKKELIKEILGTNKLVRENEKGTAFEIRVSGDEFDVIFTVPFDVHVLHYEAQNKSGQTLLTDLHDFYGTSEEDDFKDTLTQIVGIMNSPFFQLTNNGKTVEYGIINSSYLFGTYGS